MKSLNSFSTHYSKAFSLLIKAEGGYNNRTSDRGGETNFGISKRAYPWLDIQSLTLEQAKQIYHYDYWQATKCDDIPWPIAWALFDAAVNHGVRSAVKMLQKTIGTKPDGIIGPKTIAKLNQPNNVIRNVEHFLARRGHRYARIVANDPSQSVNLLGWMNRIFKLHTEILQEQHKLDGLKPPFNHI